MKKIGILITFGCSWTRGYGSGWQPGIPHDQYKKIAVDDQINDQISFRGQLARRLNFDHLNFSIQTSSNQKQFRLAREFFASSRWKNIQNSYKDIFVLWGITSTGRNELFCMQQYAMRDIMYDLQNSKTDWPEVGKPLFKYTFDHDNEVFRLGREMQFWNVFFENAGVRNLWFDTFNHHDYDCALAPLGMKESYEALAGPDWPSFKNILRNNWQGVPDHITQEIQNTLLSGYVIDPPPTVDSTRIAFYQEPHRDLLSKLALIHGIKNLDNKYHESSWKKDSNRVGKLIEVGLLNPISNHPTESAHNQIADLLQPVVEKLL
jgi:hypothetical protein